MMESILQDLRYELRTLIKSPRFTSIALITLVLGIAANVAIFTFVDAALIRPLPYRDASRLVELVARLTDAHERPQTEPWKVSDAPAEFIEQMARQIVGIEIPISKLVGKWKVSQNRSPADRQGVITRLRASTNSELSLVADVVEQAK